jgi:ribosomal protein S18 acetylase RimI-like enzyme
MTILEQRSLQLEMPIILRAATLEDLPKLEWYGQYKHFRNLFRRTYREQEAGHRIMLVADSNNFPIGHVFIQFKDPDDIFDDSGRAYLYSFRVMEMFRGHGVGTWLLQEAENITLDRGLQWMTIAVAKDNHGARRLYERIGYHIYSEDSGRWSYLDHKGIVRHVNEPCWMLQKQLRLR